LSTSDEVSVAAVTSDQFSFWQWRRQDLSSLAASGIIHFQRTESSKFCIATISSPNWK